MRIIGFNTRMEIELLVETFNSKELRLEKNMTILYVTLRAEIYRDSRPSPFGED